MLENVGLLIVALVVVYVGVLSWQHRRYGSEPPVLFSWMPYLGSALDLDKDPISFLQEQRNKLGDVFVAYIAGQRMVFVCEEVAARKSLARADMSFAAVIDKIHAGALQMRTKDIDAFPNAEVHRQYRELLLRDEALNRISTKASDKIDEILSRDKYKGATTFDLYQDLVKLVIFETSIDVMFGPGLRRDLDAGTLLKIFEDFDDAFPKMSAGAPSKEGIKARNFLAQLVLSSDYKDEASEFMKARIEMFQRLVDEKKIEYWDPKCLDPSKDKLPMQVASDVGLFIGLVSNTMPAAFWTVYYLIQLQDPTYLQNVRDEVQRNPYDPDTWPHVQAAMTEAMRLGWGGFHTRDVLKSTTVPTTSLKIRRGDRVIMCPALAHLDAAIFPDPLRFDPFRWLNTDEKKLHFNVFGGGVSMCPGRRFAQREIKMLAAKLLHHFDITLLDPAVALKPGALVESSQGAGRGIYPPTVSVKVSLTARSS